jgi:lipopolysaccharide export system permease protein
LILSFFGIFLGKTSPRGGKGVNLLIGIIVFMLYNNGLLVAKRAIELGQINLLTGFLGVHLLVLILLILLYQYRNRKIAKYIDKVSILNIKEKSHA